MDILTFMLGVSFFMWLAERQAMKDLFPDQECGYCPMMIHWDRKRAIWLHENGQQRAPLPRIKLVDHLAHPYGIAI